MHETVSVRTPMNEETGENALGGDTGFFGMQSVGPAPTPSRPRRRILPESEEERPPAAAHAHSGVFAGARRPAVVPPVSRCRPHLRSLPLAEHARDPLEHLQPNSYFWPSISPI